MNIEVPDCVIKAEVGHVDDREENITMNVQVGGVVVMTRTYPYGWHTPPIEYASSPEEAQDMVLAEFGTALRTLIGKI